jgi:hypothetical protein
MCLPTNWDVLTAKERLMETEAIREHHRSLADAVWDARESGNVTAHDEAIAAYEAHAAEHKAVAQRMRVARAERVK